MNLSRLFIERPVATVLLSAALLLCGLLGWRLLPISALPEVDYPTIQVTTLFPGASPELMASAVTAPLERQLGQMPGLEHLSSSSAGGASVITLRFTLSTLLDVAEQQVQAAIDAATTLLPADLPMTPTYSKVNPADAPVLTLAVTSATLPATQLHGIVESRLAPKISQVPGVGLVGIAGGRRPAVRIKADPAALERLGISLEALRSAIVDANVSQAKGGFDGPQRAVSIEVNDQLQTAAEFGELVVGYHKDAAVRLKDVGSAVDDAENSRLAAWSGREPAVILNIQRQPGANVIDTVDRIKALLPGLRSTLPEAADLQVVVDRTLTIRAAMHDVLLELALAVVLVVLVIHLFLRSAAATLIPAVVVPLSLAGSFAFMHLAGFSLNNLTLMALTVSTGFVVDDAIVMIENIARHAEAGEAPMAAALKGARQIGFTIISLTVSLLAVLIPLLFMGDVVGRLFHDFALTLAIAIGLSALLSLTLTPMMCAHLLRPRPSGDGGPLHSALGRTIAAYERSLRWMLAHRGLAGWVFAATLALTGWSYLAIDKGLFPVQDTGVIQVVTQAPAAVSFEAMAQRQQAVAEILLADPAVDRVSSFIGVDGTNASLDVGRLAVSLKPLRERHDGAVSVLARLSEATRGLAGVNVHLQPVQDLTLDDRVGTSAYRIALGSTSAPALADAAARLATALAARPELADVAADAQAQGPQAFVHIDRDVAGRLGVSMAAIDAALYDAYGQRLVSTIFTQTHQVRVVLELDDAHRGGLARLAELRVPGANGVLVPLATLARVEERRAPLVVEHAAQLPSATVSFNLAAGVSLGHGMAAAQEAIDGLSLPPSVELDFAGAAQAFRASLGHTLLLLAAAVFTMYVVLGVLYESFVHPVTILSTLPAAALGALLALRLCRLELDMIAVIGIVLLIGIVKKNAIMMIDFALHAQRGEGLDAAQAIQRAAVTRFRPILMTTLAALLGALPLMLGTGVGSELRHPLGVAMVGGLLVSQLLTLYSTPIIYVGFDRLAARWRRPAVPMPVPVPVSEAK